MLRKSTKPFLSTSANKVTGPDGIPVKIVKFFPYVTDNHLSNIIKNKIFQNRYSENVKFSAITSVLKKDNQAKRKSYRPISLSNVFMILCQLLPS